MYRSDKLYGEITNIGMNAENSVKELVDVVGELVNKKLTIKIDSERVRPLDSEVERLCCDNTKILKETGWRPQFDLRTGLKKTIGWFVGRQDKVVNKHNVYNV